MGLFPEIKCGKCDRRYSSIRSRCPYCGARKNHGKRAEESGGNRLTQQIIGIAVLIIVIIAVVILVASSLKKSGEEPNPSPSPSSSGSSGVNSVDGTATLPPSPSPSPSPTPSPTPTPVVNSIVLNRSDFTLFNIGEQWDLSPTVSPAGTTAVLDWRSSDPSVASVDEKGVVTAVNKGSATITASYGAVSAECVVRVNATATGVTTTTTDNNGNTSTGVVSLSHSDVTIHSSSSEWFKLTVSGSSETPSYSSSNSGVASVDGSGKVTAVSNGTATINVTVGSAQLSCTVRVVS